MFFQGWAGLERVLVVGILTYGALIVLLRLSGKRTLAKFNAFDFVVTVALGSTLATVLLDSSIALAEGILAIALLIGLQYGISWLSARSARFRSLIKSEPTLLVHQGEILEGALRSQRLSRDEIFAALRSEGYSRLEGVAAVVLETDGTITVTGSADPNESHAALEAVDDLDQSCLKAQASAHNDVHDK